MIEPTNRQRVELTRILKEFAFEESPRFKDGKAVRMSVEREFEFCDTWGYSDQTIEVSKRERTQLSMGFRAIREEVGGGYKPTYTFSVWTRIDQEIAPDQLVLPPEDWEELCDDYADLDECDDEEAQRAEVIKCIQLAGDECSMYASTDYVFDSSDGGIQFMDERGFSISNDSYGVRESKNRYPSSYEETDYEYSEIAALNAMMKEDDVTGAVTRWQNNVAFRGIIDQLEEEIEENGDIMPHESKQREMLFVIDCLRKKTLPF